MNSFLNIAVFLSLTENWIIPIQITDEYNLEGKFIEDTILLVEANIHNSEFGINSLIDEFHMSQSSLYKKIKILTGMSLTGFIRSVRLKNAAKIILHNNNPKLSSVAMDVGFNDYKYFKKSFKEHFGCLPSEYKDLIDSKKETLE
ncbi:helix-turn-helix domain-containing protein [Mariniflexile sp.]|uniref:helix-turn-helix domain-containing protein n=1 Tax=Mariniflexile sp. TaxID=1979402 RepID=UPI0040471F78